MTALDEWVERVRAELELGPVDTALVLDLARDVARGVMRPAAPVTAYLLGLAVGQGASPERAASVIGELIKAWPAGPGSAPGPAADAEPTVPDSPEPPD
jgi:hypothetical protein